VQRQVATQLQQAAQHDSGRRYLAVAATTTEAAGSSPDAVLLLRQEATAQDILEGYCAALMLAWGQQLGRGRGPSKAWPAGAQLALADVDAWLAGKNNGSGSSSGRGGSSSGGSSGNYEAFLAALASAGWALDRVALMQGQSRLAWGAADLRTD